MMIPVARESVEPLAAVTSPGLVSAKHQSLLRFLDQEPWSDDALMWRVLNCHRRRSMRSA
ncbi:hypothetical protein IQ280_09040 [Ochrobactrum anthropi]|nr:transposase [Brucella anthropi]MBK5578016.1 hypothetical protein [Brucella anthropi]MCQ9146192.1 hypothetical protein [Ochrobactrum sp. BTU2]